MVSGISQNNGMGYAQPMYAHQAMQSPVATEQQLVQQPTVDEVVFQLEDAYKKGRTRKNLIGGTVTLASLAAIIGGTVMKSKVGRALCIAPLALTTLFFGATTVAKNNKVPDFREMINEMQGIRSHQA